MTLEPSSLKIGCWPPLKSMMLRRRMPRPTAPSTKSPSSSGPRCLSAEHMRCTRSLATGRLGSRYAIPAIPHMFQPLVDIEDRVAAEGGGEGAGGATGDRGEGGLPVTRIEPLDRKPAGRRAQVDR